MAGDERNQEGPLHSQVLWRTPTAEDPGSEGASCGCCDCQDTGNRLANPQPRPTKYCNPPCAYVPRVNWTGACLLLHGYQIFDVLHVLHTRIIEVSHFILLLTSSILKVLDEGENHISYASSICAQSMLCILTAILHRGLPGHAELHQFLLCGSSQFHGLGISHPPQRTP